MGGGQQQLEQLSQELQMIEGEISELRSEIEEINQRKTEIDDAIEAIDLLETDSTVQVPLGGGAYVRAEVQDVDEIIVKIGADYALEQDRENAADALRLKKESLDDQIEEVREQISELEAESDRLETQAQQMQQQMQQQQMQQMGQLQQEGEDE
ncbi:MAG: prefoldin subunit alpha [Haloferacaceae archaeon]